MTFKSREGMSFYYYQTPEGYTAFFSRGAQSLKFTMPWDRYKRMSYSERSIWRKAKYAEAEQAFGIERMTRETPRRTPRDRVLRLEGQEVGSHR
jgi:hypothetical protein